MKGGGGGRGSRETSALHSLLCSSPAGQFGRSHGARMHYGRARGLLASRHVLEKRQNLDPWHSEVFLAEASFSACF